MHLQKQMASTYLLLLGFASSSKAGGAVTNSADKGYTELCHERGFMVWATITNNMSEKGSTNFTTKMFSDSSIQKKAIAQYSSIRASTMLTASTSTLKM